MLQLVWLMRVLRPNSVSTGSTDRQLGLLAAVAAALADALVDQHAPGRLGRPAALALAPQLGGARLVVDQHGDAVDAASSRWTSQQSRARSRTSAIAGSATRV